MRITLACVGKMKVSPEQELVKKYCKQLPWSLTIKEIDIKKNTSVEQRKQLEAEALLAACDGAQHIIALDERGKHLSSEDLARTIGDWQNNGISYIALVIGGQDGLDDTIRKKSNLTLCFGKQTWPHMMVRAMACEQLYRAHTILSGHPYHRS